MKNKIYKVLGIVLTMAIIVSSCLCAMTVAHADVTDGDITYPTFSQGNIYEKDGAAVVQTTNNGRAYTATMYKVADYEKAVVASPYQANFFFYDAAGTYVKNVGYQSAAEVKIASLAGGAAQFRVVLKDTTNNDVCTAAELASDVVALYKAEQDVTVDGVTTPVMMQANIISAQGGRVQTDSTNRIATKSQFEVAKYEKIVIADGYRMVVHFWKADGTYIGETGWQTGTKTVSALPNAATATYFRIVAGDSANSDPFAPADFPAGTLTLVQFPEDYEAPVTEDVLKDGILYPYMAPGTVNGAPNTLTTCVGAHATRLYTVTTYEVADIDKMMVAADCRAFVQFFNEDGTYNNGNGWLNPGTYTIGSMSPAKNGAKYFKVTFSSTKGGNDVNTPPADGLTFTLIPKDVIEDGVLTPALVSGTINGSPYTVDTCLSAHDTRLATYNKYEIVDFAEIIVGEGIEIFVQFFMEDGSYTAVGAGSGWLTKGTYKVAKLTGAEGAKYFRITYDSSPRGSVPTPGLMTFTLAPEEVPCEHAYDNACDADCNTCGEVREVADHVYDNACDADCNVCGEAREVADHVYENYTSNNDATCTANGTETGTCACGATDTREVADSKLDHTYENYTSNDDATCTANGTETGTCACGATDTREVADSKLDHTYDNDCDADCNACGDVREVADHVYDNDCDADCNVCGEAREVADHVYDNDCDADCNVCGEAREVADHVYDNACDADCNVCGDVREVADHVYDNDCDADCNECGDIREVAGHVYDSDCDADCNNCGEVREVADHFYNTDYDIDCNRCGEIRDAEAGFSNVEIREKDGVKYIYVDGLTAIKGLFYVDGDYYFADWGGKVICGRKVYVKSSYCDLDGGKEYTFGEDGKILNGIVEFEGVKYLYFNGITATKGIYKIGNDYYFSDWGGVIKGGTYYTSYIFTEDLTPGEYTFDENGKMLNNVIVEDEDGNSVLYIMGKTAAAGTYEVDDVTYKVGNGGIVKGIVE